jgi:hypothetical protein
MLITSLTIGYGHIVITQTGARIFLFIYGPIGIAVIGYFLLSIRDMIEESSQSRMRRAIAKRRLSLTVTASRNPNMSLMVNRKYTLTRHSLRRLNTAPGILEVPSRPASVSSNKSSSTDLPTKTFSDGTLPPSAGEEAQVARWIAEEQPVSILRPVATTNPDDTAPATTSVSFGQSTATFPGISFPDDLYQPDTPSRHSQESAAAGIPLNNMNSYARTISLDPALLLSAKDEEEIRYKSQIWAVIRMTFVWLFAWFVGSVIFDTLEPDWNYIDSLYFTWSTLTTVGYGDFIPSSPAAWEFWFWYVSTWKANFVGMFWDKWPFSPTSWQWRVNCSAHKFTPDLNEPLLERWREIPCCLQLLVFPNLEKLNLSTNTRRRRRCQTGWRNCASVILESMAKPCNCIFS